MTAFIYYHKQFSLSTIFQSFQRNFFKFFSKLFSSQNVVFAFGLHHNPKLAYCLRQLAYNNPLNFFCKAFYASFCKNFKFFFIYGKIERFVLKVHCLEANGKPKYMRVPISLACARICVCAFIYIWAHTENRHMPLTFYFLSFRLTRILFERFAICLCIIKAIIPPSNAIGASI